MTQSNRMKVLRGQIVSAHDWVRIVGNSCYAGREGRIETIVDDRQNRNPSAIVVFSGRVHGLPFLGMELEKV